MIHIYSINVYFAMYLFEHLISTVIVEGRLVTLKPICDTRKTLIENRECEGWISESHLF